MDDNEDLGPLTRGERIGRAAIYWGTLAIWAFVAWQAFKVFGGEA